MYTLVNTNPVDWKTLEGSREQSVETFGMYLNHKPKFAIVPKMFEVTNFPLKFGFYQIIYLTQKFRR